MDKKVFRFLVFFCILGHLSFTVSVELANIMR